MRKKLLPVSLMMLLALSAGCIQQDVEEAKGDLADWVKNGTVPPAEMVVGEGSVAERVANVFSSFNENDTSSFDSAELLVGIGEEAIPYLLAKADENSTYSKWAAIYALSRLGYDADDETKGAIIRGMREEFGNSAESIRIMAAGTCIVLGDKSGFPILIEGLKTNEMLLLTEPPQLVCQYSYDTLSHYAQQAHGQKCDWNKTDSAAYGGWKMWWDNEGESLEWDAEGRLYS